MIMKLTCLEVRCFRTVTFDCRKLDLVFAIKDAFPVSDNHLLIIPKRHTADYFSLAEIEKRDADRLIDILRKKFMKITQRSQALI